MARKFKVGDEVIAQKDAPYMITTNGWKGLVIDIDSRFDTCNIRVRSNGGNSEFWVNSKYFDKVEETKPKAGAEEITSIAIYRSGRKVIARSFGAFAKPLKQAEARCNPEDTFDFEIGAKLALERLFTLDETTFNCKFVVTSISRTDCPVGLTVGKIYEVINGTFRDDDGVKFPFNAPLRNHNDLAEYLTHNRNNVTTNDRSFYSDAHVSFVEIVE